MHFLRFICKEVRVAGLGAMYAGASRWPAMSYSQSVCCRISLQRRIFSRQKPLCPGDSPRGPPALRRPARAWHGGSTRHPCHLWWTPAGGGHKRRLGGALPGAGSLVPPHGTYGSHPPCPSHATASHTLPADALLLLHPVVRPATYDDHSAIINDSKLTKHPESVKGNRYFSAVEVIYVLHCRRENTKSRVYGNFKG